MTSPSESAQLPNESHDRAHSNLVDLAREVHPEWLPILGSHERLISRLLEQAFAAGTNTLPARENVLRAFRQPLSAVKVVIVGQDPYPTPGDAVGLSFSVAPGSKIPRSLKNIYAELSSDLNVPAATHGDLTAWESQGVFLLNRVLTVPAGNAGGHRKLGWESVTQSVIEAIAQSDQPLVAILWGNDAAKLEPLMSKHLVLTSAHPSPLSARRGFFGSQPFSRANAYLTEHGVTPINWELPAHSPTEDDSNMLF